MPAPQHHLVIARYAEDLGWIEAVPESFAITIYNKGGPLLPVGPRLSRAEILEVPNQGRESETYLRHLLSREWRAPGFTVLTQGDPLEHSPDFLTLLRETGNWWPVQPLALQWKASAAVPPPAILESQRADHLPQGRVRREVFSLHTMAPMHFYDWGGYNMSATYRAAYGLSPAANLAEHFLRRCLMERRAEEAGRHLAGAFSYGAILGISAERIAQLSPQVLSAMYGASLEHPINGYMFERLWLHLFGEPFLFPSGDLSLSGNVSPPGDQCELMTRTARLPVPEYMA